MNRVLELDQQFEFVKMDDSNFIYKIGQTTDYYLYNFRKKSIKKSIIFRSENALKVQELNKELEAAGPAGYPAVRDFLRNHYTIRDIKFLGSNILVSYFYKERNCFLLYNHEKQIKKIFVIGPEKSSNLIDDVLLLPIENFSYMNAANSDDNSILIYQYPERIKRYLQDQNSNTRIQSRNNENIYEFHKALKPEDNPLIIEYIFKEI